MSHERLTTLQQANDQTRAEMLIEGGRFASLRSRHETGTAPRAISAFNLFQTPERIADQMVDLLEGTNPRILEPSAGLGRLYKSAFKKFTGAEFVLVENNPDCMKELYNLSRNKNTILKQSDFLELNDLGLFDFVLMNPPFKMGTDIKHILHALKMLKPEGKLVSLCYNGTKQNRDLKPLCDTWEVLPQGSFKAEGTSAEVALLTINKGSK